MTAIIVLAKLPVPGRVKTRLLPHCSPADAARLAEAALIDTLDAARASLRASRLVLVVERFGEDVPASLGAGFSVVDQVGEGLAERLANALDVVGGPAVLVAMDTPQITGAMFDDAIAALDTDDAVLGPADDGGYWLIGMREANAAVFDGVPMSVDTTCRSQHDRLVSLGASVGTVVRLRDIDSIDDAIAVARAFPQLRTSAVVRSLFLSGESSRHA